MPQTIKQRTGSAGEQATVDWLVQRGYRVLARNWHCKAGELDIVAATGSIIAFVEVKTRRPDAMVSPLQAVNYQKQRRVIQSAQLFLQQRPCNLQPRFDVAAVTGSAATGYSVDYYEAAFDTGSCY
ncbi:MAG: YraN family protein [Angelakisella sp.]